MKIRSVTAHIVLLFCLSIAVPAFAQDSPSTTKMALIKELMALMEVSANAEALSSQIMERMRGTLLKLFSENIRKILTEEGTAKIDAKKLEAQVDEISLRIVNRIQVEMKSRINLQDVIDQIGSQVYDKYFTEAEVKDMITFYKSPTGRKSIKLIPKLFSETMQQVSLAVTPKIQSYFDEVFMDEMKKIRAKQGEQKQ